MSAPVKLTAAQAEALRLWNPFPNDVLRCLRLSLMNESIWAEQHGLLDRGGLTDAGRASLAAYDEAHHDAP